MGKLPLFVRNLNISLTIGVFNGAWNISIIQSFNTNRYISGICIDLQVYNSKDTKILYS